MRILNLTVNKHWFDMIISNVKKEEYREIKDHWKSRLCDYDIVSINNTSPLRKFIGYKKFDAVAFRNGYAKNAPEITLEFKGIEVGIPKPEWSGGLFEGEVFIIKLGGIIK